MKRSLAGCLVLLTALSGPVLAGQSTAKEETKKAGSAAKEAGKDTADAAKHAAKATGKATKKTASAAKKARPATWVTADASRPRCPRPAVDHATAARRIASRPSRARRRSGPALACMPVSQPRWP